MKDEILKTVHIGSSQHTEYRPSSEQQMREYSNMAMHAIVGNFPILYDRMEPGQTLSLDDLGCIAVPDMVVPLVVLGRAESIADGSLYVVKEESWKRRVVICGGSGISIDKFTVAQIYYTNLSTEDHVVRSSIEVTRRPMLESSQGRVYGFIGACSGKDGSLLVGEHIDWTPSFMAVFAGMSAMRSGRAHDPNWYQAIVFK